MKLPTLSVVLCGGSGTRLWPLSREQYPKQLLSLVGENTLLQDTMRRCDGIELTEQLLVCNENHRFLVAEQARSMNADCRIILEPVARNTAPAIALAAETAVREHGDAILVVLPSDHVIRDSEEFCAALEDAIKLASEGYLVTFGIEATSPQTGYGYIKAGEPLLTGHRVAAFVEKPDLETAQAYVESGEYLWNSGMFVFRASAYLEELSRLRPDIAGSVTTACDGMTTDNDFCRVDETLFTACAAESVDVAVMEHTARAALVKLAAEWSDVGSWDSLWDVSDKDEHGNAIRGDVITHDTTNSYIRSEHRLVSTVGVDDLVVVETADAVIVSTRDRSQEVKSLVESLKSEQREEPLSHRKVYRPWGFYESIDAGSRFQVKRICVNPGAKLSLQKHHHRAEHWVVVSGTAEVTCGDLVFQMAENESTYIPLGEIHRLANPGIIPLEIIEIQSGNYLGEDDIVRFEDNYGRQSQDAA